MDIIEVGRSELKGRTLGVMQTMERRAGLQVLAFMAEVKRRTRYRLTPNEGRRSRPDQRLVWNAYALYLAGRGPWAPRAAPCFTSIHDEILHGNAIDFGGPGGEVIPAAVHAVMVEIGPAYGVIWTGARFVPAEWWHFVVSPDQATIIAPADTRPAPADPKHDDEEEDEMKIKLAKYTKKPEVFAYADGSPLWWHVDEATRDQIIARHGVQVEEVDGKTFNLLRDTAAAMRAQAARDVWGLLITDPDKPTVKKTAANMLQLVLSYGRKKG